MKHLVTALSLFAFLLPGSTQANDDYTFFIRQIQLPDELEHDAAVDQKGSRESELAINPNGARFELWTVKADPLTSYLLDTTYVNSYVPVADVRVISEDPYDVIPRTRADRPFTIEIETNGLSSDPDAPEAAKSVKLLRHVQAYEGKGTGKNIDRGQATLISEGSVSDNGTHTFTYAITSIPGADRSKVRGEERISAFSMADYQAPESQLDAEFIQIWPVADVTVTGIGQDDILKNTAPDVTIDLNDLYPDSWTYAQVYKGPQVLGTEGEIVPGSSILVDSSTPKDKKVKLRGWDSVIPDDGLWTFEVITITPFGVERMMNLSFSVERKLRFNGNVTSVE